MCAVVALIDSERRCSWPVCAEVMVELSDKNDFDIFVWLNIF